MGNKKGAQTTTTSQTQASPEAMAAYRDILSRATTAADTPYTAYGGDRVAGFSPDQMAAFQATRDAQGIASPYLTEATGMARAGAAPIDAAAIERYQNPYQQSVIDATIADLQTQNAIAQTQVTGNAALRGALGGSRVGVAQALTAGEQARSQNPLIANMRASGYDKALAAAQQDRAASSSGASLMAGLGDASSTAAYRDVASLYGMGQQQQGNDQAKLDAAYQAWVQQQAYPTQQISWLSDVAGRAGGAMGSSTSGTSTAPAPNPMNAIIGAVGTVAGAALGGPMGASIGGSLGSSLGGTMGGGNKTLADGGVVPSYAAGGVVGYEDGGLVSGMSGADSMYGAPSEQPLIDLSLDNSGAYSMAGTEGLPTEMAGMEGTTSGGFNWQSIGNPLMHAGLKMMSSTSPYLGVAIGEGGQAGLKAYGDNAKADDAKKHKEAQLQLQRDRLGASLKAQREKLASENWIPLGPSNDPERPGYYFMDKKTGKTELKDMTVAPRAGASGSAGVEAAGVDKIQAERKAAGLAPLPHLDALEAYREAGRKAASRDRAEARAMKNHENRVYRTLEEARAAEGLPARVPLAPPAAASPAPAPSVMRDVTIPPPVAPIRPPPAPVSGMVMPDRRGAMPRLTVDPSGTMAVGHPAPAVPGPLPPVARAPSPTGPVTIIPDKMPPTITAEGLRGKYNEFLRSGHSAEAARVLEAMKKWGVTP